MSQNTLQSLLPIIESNLDYWLVVRMAFTIIREIVMRNYYTINLAQRKYTKQDTKGDINSLNHACMHSRNCY